MEIGGENYTYSWTWAKNYQKRHGEKAFWKYQNNHFGGRQDNWNRGIQAHVNKSLIAKISSLKYSVLTLLPLKNQFDVG